jgi:type III pantothenate kinase
MKGMDEGARGNTLCLDVGNSNLAAGVVDRDGAIGLHLRKASSAGTSADEWGVFLRAALRENDLPLGSIGRIAICSVVPAATEALRRACLQYFAIEPFVLEVGVKTGLQIAYRRPEELGVDRLANAVAASERFPGRNAIVADLGTATTLDVVSAERVYHGGIIAPGLRIGMQALQAETARLPAVPIVKPESACGRSTVESIQAGLFFGHVGMIRELARRLSAECFGSEQPEGRARPVIVATGGFSSLFADLGLFEAILPDLVLEGLYRTMLLNEPG